MKTTKIVSIVTIVSVRSLLLTRIVITVFNELAKVNYLKHLGYGGCFNILRCFEMVSFFISTFFDD